MGYRNLDDVHIPASGAVPPAAWGAQVNDNTAELWRALSQHWQAWDPEWSHINRSLSAVPLPGALLLEGLWHRVGYEVTANATYRIADDTSVVPDGDDLVFEFTLPVPGRTGPIVIGTAVMWDASEDAYAAGTVIADADGKARIVTGLGPNGLARTASPWIWATGDELTMTVTYRASTGLPPGALSPPAQLTPLQALLAAAATWHDAADYDGAANPDTAPPDLTLAAVADSAGPFVFSGTVEDLSGVGNVNVRVFDGATEVATAPGLAVIAANGDWSTPPWTPPDGITGTHSAKAYAFDLLGNAGESIAETFEIQEVSVPTVGIDPVATGPGPFAFSGVADSPIGIDTVVLTIRDSGGATIGAPVVTPSGVTWSATWDPGGIVGAGIVATVVATNTAAESQSAAVTFTIDAGATLPAPMVRGYHIGAAETTPTALLASAFATPPVAGDRILAFITADGPSAAATISWDDDGGNVIRELLGDMVRPRVLVVDLGTYAGESGWTVGADIHHRVTLLALNGGTVFAATPGAMSTTPTDPGDIVNLTDSLGVTFSTTNWDQGNGSTWTAQPGGHTEIGRQTGIAALQVLLSSTTLTTAGTYSPGPAGFGPSNDQGSSVAVTAATATSGTGQGGSGWQWNFAGESPAGTLLTHPGASELAGIFLVDMPVTDTAGLVSAVANMAPGKRIKFMADITGDNNVPSWWDWTATGNWAGTAAAPCVVDLNGYTYTSKPTDDAVFHPPGVNEGWGRMMAFKNFSWLYVLNGTLVGASATRAWTQSAIDFGYEDGAGIGTWHHAHLYGVKIDGSGGAAIHVKGNGWNGAASNVDPTCRHAKIIGCEITNVGYREDAQFGEGIYIGQGSGPSDRDVRYVEIANCWFHDHAGARTLNSSQGGEAIDVKHWSRDVDIHDCLIENWRPWSQSAITLNHNPEAWAGHTANSSVRRVMIRGCVSMRDQYQTDGSGITAGTPGVTIEDILLIDTDGCAMEVSTYPGSGGTDPAVTTQRITAWDNNSDAFVRGRGVFTLTNSISSDGTRGTHTATTADFVGPLTGDAKYLGKRGAGFTLKAASSIPASAGALGKL